jgi:hypothetical protein
MEERNHSRVTFEGGAHRPTQLLFYKQSISLLSIFHSPFPVFVLSSLFSVLPAPFSVFSVPLLLIVPLLLW